MHTIYHSEYKNCIIWRQWGGCALPYTAMIDGMGSVSTDTLAGIKRLICERLASRIIEKK